MLAPCDQRCALSEWPRRDWNRFHAARFQYRPEGSTELRIAGHAVRTGDPPYPRLLLLAILVLHKQITDLPPQAFFGHRTRIGEIHICACGCIELWPFHQ